MIVATVLEEAPEAVASRLRAIPPGVDLVEIRADRLRAADLPGLLAAAPRPAIVAARPVEGRSDAERRALLLAALAAGAAFVDVEEGSALAGLAEGDHAPRAILSHHGAGAREAYARMRGSRAARLKIVPQAERLGDAALVRDLLGEAARDGRALACFATGDAGIPSRILALSWGSWATYGSAAEDRPAAPGQLPAADLLDVHDVRAIGPRTVLYGLAGRPVDRSPSPRLHDGWLRALGRDARYLPLPASSVEELDALPFRLAGFGVTIPLKAAAASRCVERDAVVAGAGAANTVLPGPAGWRGFNTDAPAALDLVREHLDPRGARVAIVGAGGTARAVGWILGREGAEVAFYARSPQQGMQPLAALPTARWDLLVQATPLGREGEEVLPASALTGRVVLDAAYGPEQTPLVRDARARGLVAIDGHALLLAQARRQFAILTGEEPPAQGAPSGRGESTAPPP